MLIPQLGQSYAQSLAPHFFLHRPGHPEMNTPNTEFRCSLAVLFSLALSSLREETKLLPTGVSRHSEGSTTGRRPVQSRPREGRDDQRG